MPRWFTIALIISSFLASAFWMFQLVFAYIVLIREQKYTEKECPPITIVIPTYNEKQEALDATIKSVLKQNVRKQILVIDDGSEIPAVITDPEVCLIRLEKNQGKRHAQAEGFRLAEHDWIATIDGDTILDENAIWHLYKTCESNNLDACTGTVAISNENENWLTRMASCMYWFSFFQERASQNYFRSMMCCSGAISLYRKSIIEKHIDSYLNQRFFGLKCVAGDDRHLTNIFLLSGCKVGWSSKAIAYTPSPPTTKKFIKQQLRWVRSHVTSFGYLLLNIRQWSFIFFLFTFKLIYRYVYMAFIYISIIIMCFYGKSLSPLFFAFISFVLVTLIKSFIAFSHTGKTKFFNMILFSFYNFFLFCPIMLFGVCTPHYVGWYTRDIEKSKIKTGTTIEDKNC